MTNRMRISMWNKISMKTTRMMMTKMTMNRNKNKKRHQNQNLNKTILNLSKINKNPNKIIKTNPSAGLNRAKTGTIRAITASH